MKRIKVMADYHCWPLWEAGDELGDIDPASLPISDELRAGLLEWAREFDAILNAEDPAASGFPSPAAKRQFDKDGRSLAGQLASELRETHEVLYYSVRNASVEPVPVVGAV